MRGSLLGWKINRSTQLAPYGPSLLTISRRVTKVIIPERTNEKKRCENATRSKGSMSEDRLSASGPETLRRTVASFGVIDRVRRIKVSATGSKTKRPRAFACLLARGITPALTSSHLD